MIIVGSLIAILIVIMTLVSALLYAKAKLVPSGDLNIIINGED